MDAVFLIIGWLSIPMVLAAAYLMITTLKKEQSLRGRTLFLMAVIAVAILFIYEALLDAERSAVSWWLLSGGLIAGGWVSSTAELRLAGNDVFGTRSYWYLGLWAGAYGFSQMAALGALPADVGTGLASLYLATGIATGLNMGLWYRQSILRDRAKAAGPAATSSCPSCGTPSDASAVQCSGCSRHLILSVTPTPSLEELSHA